MACRQTTIFRQLIFNIAIPTLLVLLVFAGINFQRTSSILVSGNYLRAIANETGMDPVNENIYVVSSNYIITNRTLWDQ